MTDQELIPANTTEHDIEYTLETLPPLTPQQSLMLEYILEGNNYTEAYRKAGYKSTDLAHTSACILIGRNPLKAHLSFFIRESAKRLTPEYKADMLMRIANNAMRNASEIKDTEVAIKAIDVMAKIQGHYAPTNVNVSSMQTSIEDIRNARLIYKKDK